MEQAKQGGNETAPEMAGYYRGAGCFSLKAAELNELLGVGRCFDMTGRDLSIGGRQARLWVVNGYAQDDLLERVIAGWQALPDLNGVTDAADFCRRYVSACDAAAEPDRDAAVMGVFAGKTLAIIDGFGGGVVLDAKQFPTRSVEEPDTSRVLRGSHDGFVENLMQNAALLRRRVRDTHLRLERLQLPERSGTDVALCYMEGEADEGLLQALREKLMHIQLRSVAMSQETIAEAIAPRQFWNPLGCGKLSTHSPSANSGRGAPLVIQLPHNVVIHTSVCNFERVHQLVHYAPRFYRITSLYRLHKFTITKCCIRCRCA